MYRTALFIGAGALLAGVLSAAPICPTTTNNSTGADTTGCSVLITFDATGTPAITTTSTGTYDGAEDVTVGVINNSSGAISTLTLSSSSGTDAFGWDGDGIQTYTANNGVTIATGGATGYEGPTSTFDNSGVVNGDGTLVINFSPSIAPGGNTYFSLEGTPSIGSGISVTGGGPGTTGPGSGAAPEPASLAMIGGGLSALALLVKRRK